LVAIYSSQGKEEEKKWRGNDRDDMDFNDKEKTTDGRLRLRLN
jgi:hypothetical protein